ncbi:methyltransferase domain-containing protein [Candidatus Saccharibacteria bacterium]|jgi:tRNA (guanine10-N2)-dimethyltransferase|nr:methyltransferase domain-containing protein [Candidatus Saccharibacteria bacterium]HOR23184.1 DNA methyltransferase [Candidatus Saccharibacteria bacterium]
MSSLLVLGRQPDIGLAELESLYGHANFERLEPGIALCKLAAEDIKFSRLGGVVKLAEVISVTDKSDIKFKISNLLTDLHHAKSARLNFGISIYGDSGFSLPDIKKLAFFVKNKLIKEKVNIRYVQNKALELSSAQIIHNKLTSRNNLEVIIVKKNKRYILAKTVAVQDIYAYSQRDQKRPKRDARIGMLPPKLAQIIINLASSNIDLNKIVLDPFCGSGVILQEALLMGFKAMGSDNDSRMVSYSSQNLHWLESKNNAKYNYSLFKLDATKESWPSEFDFVASETYLGHPYSTLPSLKELNDNIANTDLIIKSFLKNLHKQCPPKTRICLALPAWFLGNQVKHLPTLDHLQVLGYNRVAFKLVKQHDLIYHRPNQTVGRELVTLIRN